MTAAEPKTERRIPRPAAEDIECAVDIGGGFLVYASMRAADHLQARFAVAGSHASGMAAVPRELLRRIERLLDAHPSPAKPDALDELRALLTGGKQGKSGDGR